MMIKCVVTREIAQVNGRLVHREYIHNTIIFQYNGPSLLLKHPWNFSIILLSSAHGPCCALGNPLSNVAFAELIFLSVPREGRLGVPVQVEIVPVRLAIVEEGLGIATLLLPPPVRHLMHILRVTLYTNASFGFAANCHPFFANISVRSASKFPRKQPAIEVSIAILSGCLYQVRERLKQYQNQPRRHN